MAIDALNSHHANLYLATKMSVPDFPMKCSVASKRFNVLNQRISFLSIYFFWWKWLVWHCDLGHRSYARSLKSLRFFG